MIIKKQVRNSLKAFIILLIVSFILYPQREKDIILDAPPLSQNYIRISDTESLYTWTIASLREPSSLSDIFIDGRDRVHFAYFDNVLGYPVYVTGKNGKFTRSKLDNISGGKLISMAVDDSSYVHIAYEKLNKIWYANNNGGVFQNYAMDLKEGIKLKNLKLVISAFNSPVLFFNDVKGSVFVSRFYRDNFFSDFVYTNKKIDSLYPKAEKDGYALYMKEYETGNILYGSRKTNTAFKFFDNNAIVTNADKFAVYHEVHNRFNIVYTSRENPNNIYYTKFYEGVFLRGLLKKENEKINNIALSINYASEPVVLYVKENGNKYIYMDGQTFDLSVLGTSKGDISFINGRYPYFYFLYYNDIFKELRLTMFNAGDIINMRKSR